MPACSVFGCKNRSQFKNRKDHGITYHMYPSIPEQKFKWMICAGNDSKWYPSKSSTICSVHFEEACFQNLKRRRLFDWATPTLKLRLIQDNPVLQPCQSRCTVEKADSAEIGDESSAILGEDESGGGGRGGEDACAACGGPVNKHGLIVRGSPEELNEKKLLCNDCDKRYCNKGKQKAQKNPKKSSQSKGGSQRLSLSEESENFNVFAPPTSDGSAAPQQTITLPKFKRALCRSEGCLFPDCQIETLNIIPQYVKQCLLRDYKLYTPKDSRVCKEHLFSKKWELLLYTARTDFTAQQIEDIISILTTNATELNFENIENVPPNLLLYCTGINHRQLQKIVNQLPLLKIKTKTPVLALTAYLTKLRMNDSFDRLSTLFHTKKIILEKLTTVARYCMLEAFIPGQWSFPLPSEKIEKVSGVVTEDDQVLAYLHEHYYGDGAKSKSKPSQGRKRKNSCDLDSDDDSPASKVIAKKQPMKRKVETNQSIKKKSKQYGVLKVEVEFESPEVGVASESSEDEEKSKQPRLKKEPDDECETMGEEDQHLLYPPNSTEELQADPLDTVPSLLEKMKSEEGCITIKVEPVEEDSEALPTAGTSQATGDSFCTVYYTKGATNFVQGPGSKLQNMKNEKMQHTSELP